MSAIISLHRNPESDLRSIRAIPGWVAAGQLLAASIYSNTRKAKASLMRRDAGCVRRWENSPERKMPVGVEEDPEAAKDQDLRRLCGSSTRFPRSRRGHVVICCLSYFSIMEGGKLPASAVTRRNMLPPALPPAALRPGRGLLVIQQWQLGNHTGTPTGRMLGAIVRQ